MAIAEDARRARGDRIPPHNLEAEGSVLGSMMLSPDAIADVQGKLMAEDFYRTANGQLFDAMIGLYAKGSPVDIITVVEELKRRGQLEAMGGHLAIHEMVQNVATPASAAHYGRIVSELALMRRLVRAAGEIMEMGYASAEPPETIADAAEEMIYKVARHHEDDQIAPMSAMINNAIDELEKSQSRDSAFVGIPTGFTDLDKLTAGLQGGNLIVIAARPGVGKSSFVTNLARNVAIEARETVAMFSLEMSRWEIGMRLLCGEARVPWERIRGGKPTADDWTRIVAAAEVLDDAPFHVVDAGNVSIASIRSTARRLSHRHGLGLIIVDYLQLMSSHGRVESRQQEIAEISRGLKLLAKEMDIPVIAVSQLNRDPERRQDKRPQLSDLRECVTGETLVLLADGRRVPIVDLVDTEPEVLAVSREGRLVVAKADKVWPVGARPVFLIRTASGRSLRVTAEHRLLTDAGWSRVHDLALGDRLAIARKVPEPAAATAWPDERVVLLGHLIGGQVAVAQGAPLEYRTRHEANAGAVTVTAERAFGLTPAWTPDRVHTLRCGTGADGLARWMHALRPQGGSRVPEEVFALPDRQVAMFVRHVWAAGGVILTDRDRSDRPGERLGQISLTSSQLGYVQDLAACLLRLGIHAQVSASRGAIGEQRFEVRLTDRAEQARFLERVGAFGGQVPGAEELAAMLAQSDRSRDKLEEAASFTLIEDEDVGLGGSGRMVASLGSGSGSGSGFGSAGREGDRHALPWHPSKAGRPTSRQTSSGDATQGDVELLVKEEVIPAGFTAAHDLRWDPIEAITIDGDDEVFDLTVPGPASWLADGLVNHNSGAIEQDADIVMFIHREDSEDPTVKGTADLLLSKHRNGPTGVVKLTFLPSLTQFRNYAPPQAPPGGASYGASSYGSGGGGGGSRGGGQSSGGGSQYGPS